MKILAVDDDDITLSVLENTLTRAGYEVLLASNGQQAWDILKQGDIRLVITDWVMPGMSGIEFCELIRNTRFPWYVYVILLTSSNQEEDIQIGLSAGADDYITKPFDLNEFNLRVQIGERILSSKVQGVTVFALAKLAESRNPESGFHLERVRRYSWILVTELGKMDKYKDIITHEYRNNVYLVSSLHDIGKIRIPDSILLKPGKLDYDEWLIMKTHAAKGAKVLQNVLEQYPGMAFLEIARDVACCHHEKNDGTGYPYGLKGEEIPLAGRIVALADVYDGIINKQVYKKALTHQDARSYIVENPGKHFDPDVIKAFLANESLFMEIHNHLRDNKQLTTMKPQEMVV